MTKLKKAELFQLKMNFNSGKCWGLNFQCGAYLQGLSERHGINRPSAELKSRSEVQIHTGIWEQAHA